jgi:hypothetical protein
MTETSLKEFLLKLNKNYHVLREREAKYAFAAPLDLLNQIDDYERAIELTEQAIEQDIPLDNLQTEFSGLNLQIDTVVFVAQETPRKPFTGQNPYRGLRKFTEDEAEFFFGRDAAIQSLLDTVKYLVETETSRREPDLVAVLGASGSGKSSLVRAGLIPALWEGRISGSNQWPIKVMLPGPRPLDALAEVFIGEVERGLGAIRKELDDGEKALHYLMVEALAGKPKDAVYVLVVDQFEELFALCEDEAERRAFLDQLLYACQVRGNRGFVVLTMRADFYAKAAHYKNLAETITRNQMLVSPMTEKELREAILLPAEATGLELEKDLVQVLVHDTFDAPGALPLLQHALQELFERKDGNLLTMNAYQEIEGIKGAIAHRADSIMDDLTPEQKEIARRIFLQLIQLGEGTADMRRRATFEEVLTQAGQTSEIQSIVQRLVGANLLVTNRNPETDDVVLDVSHEALIQEWPTLRKWLDEDRQGLLIRQQLRQAAQDWQRRDRDKDGLYRGARLLEVEEWVTSNPDVINVLEQQFLEASIKARKRARRRRQMVIAGAITFGFIVVMSILVVTAFQRGMAEERAMAEFEKDAAQESEHGAWLAKSEATSRELAAMALLNLEKDPELSILLALEAVSESDTPEAIEALRLAVDASEIEDVDELLRLAEQRLTRWWTPEECEKYLRRTECPPPPSSLSQ